MVCNREKDSQPILYFSKSFITMYIAKATESKESVTVKTGKPNPKYSSAYLPPKTPAVITTAICTAIEE